MGSRVVLGGERMVYHRKWGRATDFVGKLGSFSEGEKKTKPAAKLLTLRCSWQCVASPRSFGIIKSDCKKATIYPKVMDF